jgi:phosphatidylinositol-3-phosphatase
MAPRWKAGLFVAALVVCASQLGHAATYFSDTFDTGDALQWTPTSGTWSICQPPGVVGNRYCQSAPDFLPPMSLAGDNGWADYYVRAAVNMDNDAKGVVGILGRVQDKFHFYELRLEKDAAGVKKWWIYKNASNTFTALASGPFNYQRATDYVLKLSLTSTSLVASVSFDNGVTFNSLGRATDSQYRVGRIGLKTKSTAAQFDAVTVNSAGGTTANTHRFGHIVLVTLENHSESEVVGSPYLPYFNSLAARYALADNFYANGHPSAPNYFAWTTGRFFFQQTPIPAGTNNVVKRLISSGKTWGAYFDDPAVATNPFQYLPEVAASPAQLAKVVPIVPNWANAYSANKLPQYVMIHGSETNNGHACRGAQPCLLTADTWLQNAVQPYIDSVGFTANHDLLIVAWDEGNLLDNVCSPGPVTILMPDDVRKAGGWMCGGHTVFVVVASDVKPGYVSTTIYHDESILRLMLEGLGVTVNIPGAGSFAADMNEFFIGS